MATTMDPTTRTDPLAYLQAEIDDLRAKNLYRPLRIMSGPQAVHTTVMGRPVISLSSNNYLGLTTHLRLVEAALNAVREFRPDVAFLDIGMPGKTGYEVAEAVRAEPWGHEIKLIAVTGWGQPDDRLRARTAGFDRHLIKPIDPAEVDRLLDS